MKRRSPALSTVARAASIARSNRTATTPFSRLVSGDYQRLYALAGYLISLARLIARLRQCSSTIIPECLVLPAGYSVTPLRSHFQTATTNMRSRR